MNEFHVENIAVGELQPNKRNTRTHSKKQLHQIAASIREFGFNNPVLVDQNGMILAGHGRVEAAKLLNLPAVPVIRIEHLTDVQKRAYATADNKIALNAGWDLDMLALDFKELAALDLPFDMEITGFETAEIDTLIDGPSTRAKLDRADTIPNIEKVAVSRPGDVSLADFAKIVEVFDAHEVSFVSVTQQFNTTSSMGRLTLNVLLSFAQFEREVTGERIRDKIAASKKKGLWMGGWVAIGYDRKDRTLIINEPEAEIVRTIFRLYLQLKNVRLVEAELDRIKLRTKSYVTTKGRAIGNRPFSRGHIYKILSCPLYVGEIAHKGHRYPAQHPPIVDPATWDAVHKQLQINGHAHQSRANSKEISLLAGLLFDVDGNRLIATHATKNNKRYRYYVQQIRDRRSVDGGRSPLRIPATDIETVVVKELIRLLTDQQRLVSALHINESEPTQLSRVFVSAKELSSELKSSAAVASRVVIQRIVQRITIEKSSVRIELERKSLLANWLGQAAPADAGRHESLILETEINLVRRGNETKLIIQGSDVSERQPAAALIKVIARGHHWFDELSTGQAQSMREIAAAEGVTERFIAQQMQLAFVAPSLVEGILAGQIGWGTTAKRLIHPDELPVAWSRQIDIVVRHDIGVAAEQAHEE